jgi:hypothetical protein
MRSIAISGTYAPELLAIADYTVPHLGALQIVADVDSAGLEILACS